MRRYLVVAHRTLGGAHLMEHLHHLREQDPYCRFHVLIPRYHPTDHAWTEGEVEVAAASRLDEMLETLASMGMGATGSVGDANPVEAVGDTIRRETTEPFCGIVISTLPQGRSVWWRSNVPKRIADRHPRLSVTHLVAEDSLVG